MPHSPPAAWWRRFLSSARTRRALSSARTRRGWSAGGRPEVLSSAGTWLAGMSASLRDLADALVDLALPRFCVGCRAPGRWLCPACAPALGGPAQRRDPRPRPAGLPPVHTAGSYRGVHRGAVLAHKERGVRSLTRPLGRALAAAVQSVLDEVGAAPGTPVALVAVPTSRAAIASRGDDTVALLAAAAAASLRRQGLPVTVVKALRPTRRRADQAGLSAAARAANLAGAFALSRRGTRRLRRALGAECGGLVVVVDDIVTTGATARAAVAALAARGVTVAGVAAVAAPVRRPSGRTEPGDRPPSGAGKG